MSDKNKNEIFEKIIKSIGDSILYKLLNNKYFRKNQNEEIGYCNN